MTSRCKFLDRVAQGLGVLPDQRRSLHVDRVKRDGTLLGKGHQTWQMNEINKLIWPTPGGSAS